MIPTLAATYGGDPEAWLRLPLVWLRAFAQQAPRIEAQRALAAATAAITPHLKDGGRAALRRWERLAQAGGRPRGTRRREPMDRAQFGRMLAVLGLAGDTVTG